ncbi:MAG: helix-turn-helix domain-containing protein [Pelagimonas sp.]|jgi:DNA-binding transcriptional MerR regulator|nr:helix-turn-helix domain-containing protein [Pelagimonas sp.]
MEKLLDIAEVSDQSGVSASGLRYYEKKKLIGSVARNGLRRQYEPDVPQQLALISLAKSAGFTLDEIGSVLNRPGTTVIPRAALIDKASNLEDQAKRLVNFADMLRHVANCSYDDHFECSRFQKLLKVATRVTTN